jgi:hypothetical protein
MGQLGHQSGLNGLELAMGSRLAFKMAEGVAVVDAVVFAVVVPNSDGALGNDLLPKLLYPNFAGDGVGEVEIGAHSSPPLGGWVLPSWSLIKQPSFS